MDDMSNKVSDVMAKISAAYDSPMGLCRRIIVRAFPGSFPDMEIEIGAYERFSCKPYGEKSEDELLISAADHLMKLCTENTELKLRIELLEACTTPAESDKTKGRL